MSVALNQIAQLWHRKCSVEYIRDLEVHGFVTRIIFIYVFIFVFSQREKSTNSASRCLTSGGGWQEHLMDCVVVRLQEMNVRNESWQPDMFELL